MAQTKKLGFAENFALSGVITVISKTATAPIERIKLLIQNQAEIIKAGRLKEPYKGAIDCTVRVYRTEGVLPFWRGNLANCIIYFPAQALNFAFKDKIKAMFNMKKTDSYRVKLTKNILSGGAAGALSLCFVYSLDYARTRLANDVRSAGKGATRQFNGLVDVYRKTLKSDGFVGLYRGFMISCVGIIVYRGCYFGFYDTLKPILLGDDAGVILSFCLGYAVTVSAGLVSYPIDTIRRRMLMRSGEAIKYKGSLDCAIQILKNEGMMSFMKGAGVSILHGVAGAGVLAGFSKFTELYIKWRLG